MSKKKVYASLEIADQEVRLVVLEVFDGRYDSTGKEIRRGMDISKLLIGGTFGKIY